MPWLWAVIKEGGPWAAFLILLGAVVWMRLTDRWVTERGVDRIVAGYVETNKNLTTELAFWRAAAQDSNRTAQTLAEQNAQLMAQGKVAAHFWESVKEAKP